MMKTTHNKTANNFLMKGLLLTMFCILILALQTDQVAAASEDTISDIATIFYQKSSLWTSTLQKYALTLFQMLMVLEVCIFGIKAALQRTEIADVIAQFMMTILFGAFIYVVILNYADWAWQIINGFKSVAQNVEPASQVTVGPFQTGLKIVGIILEKVSIFSPGESLGYLICGLIVLICFALMTAQVLFIKCEAYIALNAAIILLGFGPCSYFKEYAINTMRYVLSVAFKLFVLQLVLGLGLSFILDLESSASAQDTDMLLTIGVSVVLLALVKSLPDVAAGIINGSHVSSGTALTAAAAGVASVITAGAAATIAAPSRGMDALKNIKAAASLAGEQGKSGMGKMAGTAGNLWSAHQDTRHDKASNMHQDLQGKISQTRSGNEAAKQNSSMGNGGGA